MKFSSNGYYVEKYEKCSVCGKLVYENRIETLNIQGVQSLFCSDWCVDWEKIRIQKKKQAQKLLI
ncbi:hypothetical protein CN689_24855 [Peribacillus butanolivorans]|uniref:TRASH domain-containing protein n=1 Tax=Peribacillus butanolivorans TaxID=421767 RepID=A0AAX0RWS4_9BACI|nr:hypothetical protein [Peribacillus butanolivorans]PEJ26682.1 hypothetical protein CN689_24855 [Peribacillus butanolivorans]